MHMKAVAVIQSVRVPDPILPNRTRYRTQPSVFQTKGLRKIVGSCATWHLVWTELVKPKRTVWGLQYMPLFGCECAIFICRDATALTAKSEMLKDKESYAQSGRGAFYAQSGGALST